MYIALKLPFSSSKVCAAWHRLRGVAFAVSRLKVVVRLGFFSVCELNTGLLMPKRDEYGSGLHLVMAYRCARNRRCHACAICKGTDVPCMRKNVSKLKHAKQPCGLLINLRHRPAIGFCIYSRVLLIVAPWDLCTTLYLVSVRWKDWEMAREKRKPVLGREHSWG